MAAGRPTKLSKPRIDTICESIALGTNYEQAARGAGIHPATLYRWKDVGEAVLTALGNGTKAADLSEQERLAASFCEGIEKAEATAELAMLAVVRNAALGSPAKVVDGVEVEPAQSPVWQAAMTFLERKYPGRWSRRIHVHDDTPRTPADVNGDRVTEFAEAFRAAFGADALDGIDPANLMPAGLDPAEVDQGTNGHAGNGNGNGRRNGAG